MATRTEKIPLSLQVEITGIDKNACVQDLVNLFSNVGKIQGAKIFFSQFMTPGQGGYVSASNGHGLVEFAEEESVRAAIERMNGTIFMSRKINVAKRELK